MTEEQWKILYWVLTVVLPIIVGWIMKRWPALPEPYASWLKAIGQPTMQDWVAEAYNISLLKTAEQRKLWVRERIQAVGKSKGIDIPNEGADLLIQWAMAAYLKMLKKDGAVK